MAEIEDLGFVPPESGVPKVPVSPPEPSRTALPAQVYEGIQPSPQTVAPAKKKKWVWVVPVVVFATLVVAGLVYGAIVVSNSVSKVVSEGLKEAQIDSDPWAPAPVVGEPGSSVAREPLDCPGSCFTSENIADAAPNKNAIALLSDFEVTAPFGYYQPMDASTGYASIVEQWKSGHGSPDECFFASTFAPTATSLTEGEPFPNDQIYFLGEYQDRFSEQIGFSARLFADSKSAETYIGGLADAVLGCARYSIAYEGETEPYPVLVTPVPDLGLPKSMAGSGWIERDVFDSAGYFYVVTLQRGNLVTQIYLNSNLTISEADFRRFVNSYAAQLASIQPAGDSSG